MIDYDLLDKIIDNEPSLDTLLARNNIQADDALTAAKLYRRRYAELLDITGLSDLKKPTLWIEFIRSCKAEMTEDKRELLEFLLAGGSLLTEEYECDEDLIYSWLNVSEKQKHLSEDLKTRRESSHEFAAISERLARIPQPKNYPQADEYSAAFALLCEEDYAGSQKDLQILACNISNIDSIITAAELTDIAPLVYFRIYVRNRKKLYEKSDYTPTIKNLFTYEEYNIAADNGKNFDRYTLYTQLYLELKECFPDADHALCDAGFVAISNLAEWCADNLEFTEDMPLTDTSLVEQFVVMCFDDPWQDNPFWLSESILIDQLWKWQNSMTALLSHIRRAVKEVRFEQLAEFAEDTNAFAARIFSDGRIAEKLRPDQFNAARALLMSELESRFDNLLAQELAELTKL